MRSGACASAAGLASGPVGGASRVVVNSSPMASPVLPGADRHFRARSGSFGAAEDGLLSGKLQGASQKEEGESRGVKWDWNLSGFAGEGIDSEGFELIV